ncbi:hypothetical protein AXF42_Ash001983 [Apostasia shenzhenica]|uniref:Transposase MuDR plant domain-containing protein n=1 Tax=Apostasia shenzhenica TaxID=1088818 RepID=A0A2I0ABS4_9ASPA|nr:hypothetical protein AXF42_Ash001983 [Apostasia shenzhenica]
MIRYCMQCGISFKKVKNDKKRYTMTCAAVGCNWRVHASRLKDGITFKIKSVSSKHVCTKSPANRFATYKWIANELEDQLRVDPNMKYNLMSQELTKKYYIKPSKKKLWRAREEAKKRFYGDFFDTFTLFPAYAKLILQNSPNSLVFIAYDCNLPNNIKRFEKFFYCFEACKKGFLEGCMPIISLDGLPLKW